MRLLNISNFKKLYLEKTVAFKTKVSPTLIRVIRDMEDGIEILAIFDSNVFKTRS